MYPRHCCQVRAVTYRSLCLSCSETSGAAGLGFRMESKFSVLMGAVTRCVSILYHSLFQKGLRGLTWWVAFNTITVLVLVGLSHGGPLCGWGCWVGRAVKNLPLWHRKQEDSGAETTNSGASVWFQEAVRWDRATSQGTRWLGF